MSGYTAWYTCSNCGRHSSFYKKGQACYSCTMKSALGCTGLFLVRIVVMEPRSPQCQLPSQDYWRDDG